ncbi:MAG: hypothetical protein RMK99_14765, partial [Anaerolineales bacterium]|nr:hypothetical protein [Anaerolineales bacterium]
QQEQGGDQRAQKEFAFHRRPPLRARASHIPPPSAPSRTAPIAGAFRSGTDGEEGKTEDLRLMST